MRNPEPNHDDSRRLTTSRSWVIFFTVCALALASFAAHRSDAATQRPASVTPSARSVQERLVALRYLPADAVSAKWDYRTSQAVLAFQGWQRLTRDGYVGPQTWAALKSASAPSPRPAGRGRVLEVFRDLGVTLLVDDSRLVRAVHSSTGKPGYQTPSGVYRVFRKERNSWSYPYRVWLPYASYFNGGIAFHASSDVPAFAASHGCVRIPAPEGAFVYGFARTGTLVVVY